MERRARRPEEGTWQDLLSQGDDGSLRPPGLSGEMRDLSEPKQCVHITQKHLGERRMARWTHFKPV